MREFIVWARTNNVKVINAKVNPKNPDCVIIPSEKSCIKDQSTIEGYEIYDKFIDGFPLEEADRSNFIF
jgi:hypothetical protein